jgi:hypothetical protein
VARAEAAKIPSKAMLFFKAIHMTIAASPAILHQSLATEAPQSDWHPDMMTIVAPINDRITPVSIMGIEN